MADILFTHSYFLKFDPKEHRAMMPYAPLGTLFAAAQARSLHYSVALFDSMLAETELDLREHLFQHRPRVVVIYDDDFNYLTKMCLSRMRQAAFTLSSLAKEYGCTVIVHGSDAADHIEEYLSHGADFVIVGEGERTLSELLAAILESNPPAYDHIDGVAYSRENVICKNQPRTVLHDLDQLPFPAWDLVDVNLYRQRWENRHGYFSMNLVTTRGCPFHCNWCAKPIYGQVYHSHSPEYVVEQLKYLRATYSPEHIWFCDDIFGLKPGWVSRFADEVEKQDVRIPFKCLSRADLLLKEEAIRHLARSGCQTVWIGAESGSQKILDGMEKGTTIGQIHESSRLLRERGIRVGFFLQYGYPGETRADIERTLQMVKECQPDEIGISVSYPLPGTKFYDRVKQELGEKQNWVDSQDLAMMYTGPYSTEFYRALHRVTHKKFRIWKGLEILGDVVTHPSHLNRRTVRSLAAGAYHAITLPRIERHMNSLASKLNGISASAQNKSEG